MGPWVGMEEDVSKLIASIYSAFLSPDEMLSMLKGVTNFVGGEMAFLTTANLDKLVTGSVDAAVILNHDPETQQLYNDRFNALDPRADVVLKSVVGQTTHAQAVIENDKIKNTEFFDFLIKVNSADSLYAILGESEKFGHVGLSINRHFGTAYFDDKHIARLELLVPHLVNALNISTDLRDAVFSRSRPALEGTAVFLLVSADAAFLPLAENWQDIFNQISGIAVKQGKLMAAIPQFQDRLESAVKSALSNGQGDAFLLPQAKGKNCIVRVGPVPERARFLFLDYGKPYALVQLQLPAVRSESGALRFASSFGLTEKETVLLRSLLETFNLRQSAELNEITYETARSYMKAILAKTHSANQAELLVKFDRTDRS